MSRKYYYKLFRICNAFPLCLYPMFMCVYTGHFVILFGFANLKFKREIYALCGFISISQLVCPL